MISPTSLQTTSSPLIDRREFIGLDDPGYLYTGAHSPALRAVHDEISAAYKAKSFGPVGRDYLFEHEQVTRSHLAQLAGVSPSSVGMLGDASTAWSGIANGWNWKPGDNIVVNEFEHPAVFAPFLRLREQGLDVRIVPRTADWDLPTSSLMNACDDRTVAIGLSHVGYVNGLRSDLSEIGALTRSAGIPLLVDVSHSLGVVPVDLTDVSIAVSASYKWLLGPYGVGIVFWNQELLPDFRPGAVGWRSLEDIFTDRRFDDLNWHSDATRFQIGAPALAEIAGLGAGVERLLQIGIDTIALHSSELVTRAHQGLRDLDLTVITPSDRARRAGNLAFLHPDGEAVAAHLFQQGVKVWGGDGRVRASFHVMNDDDDVELLLTSLANTLRVFPIEGAA